MRSSNIIWRRREFAPRHPLSGSGIVSGLGFGLVLTLLFLTGFSARTATKEAFTYTGCCDGSAAAPVNEQLFAAGSDEGNVLRLYRRDAGGAPVSTLNVSPFLGLGRNDEADIEGAARVGEHIFWIGSHSRNDQGKARPGRHVLFATVVQGEGLQATLATAGRPFRRLVVALSEDPQMKAYDFAGGAAKSGEAPGGLNIEGMATGPDGSLLIAFRNPVPQGRALLVPLLNPREVVIQGEAPRFGAPILLDLGGLGFRDIARTGDGYLVLAGPAEGGGRHRLFLWAGGTEAAREVPWKFPKGFQAEAVVVDAGSRTTALVLSDDDSAKLDGKRCDGLADVSRRSFRASRVEW